MLTLVNNSSSKGCIRQTSFNYTNSPLLFVTRVSLWGWLCSSLPLSRHWEMFLFHRPTVLVRSRCMGAGFANALRRFACRLASLVQSSRLKACACMRTHPDGLFRRVSYVFW